MYYAAPAENISCAKIRTAEGLELAILVYKGIGGKVCNKTLAWARRLTTSSCHDESVPEGQDPKRRGR